MRQAGESPRDWRTRVNRNLDVNEMLIMHYMRNNIDPSDYINDRENLKFEAKEAQTELNKSYE